MVPAGLSDTQAAALGLAGITALDAITELGLTTDDTVLVVGASGDDGSPCSWPPPRGHG